MSAIETHYTEKKMKCLKLNICNHCCQGNKNFPKFFLFQYNQNLFLKRSAVVKAFNVLSAYALQSGGLQGSKEVFYAGDVHAAKEEVAPVSYTHLTLPTIYSV